MYTQDPVTLVKLTDFVARCLTEAQERSGGFKRFETLYLQNADPAVLRQLFAKLQKSTMSPNIKI